MPVSSCNTRPAQAECSVRAGSGDGKLKHSRPVVVAAVALLCELRRGPSQESQAKGFTRAAAAADNQECLTESNVVSSVSGS
eukprot:1519642-Pleurochrysis_carterae.AAC.1